MSRYEPLAKFLTRQKRDHWDASFAEIEATLGAPLPASAYRHQAWWANQTGSGHSQTHGWRSAGWRTAALDLANRRVRFERDTDTPAVVGNAQPTGRAALLARAAELAGIAEEERLLDEALKALIARESAARLAQLGGTMPDYAAPPRERS